MSIADWGMATWYLFHTLAEKLKPTEETHVSLLLNQITTRVEQLLELWLQSYLLVRGLLLTQINTLPFI